eukprot:m.451521 g.451521  ORF g.451521 m.451521 type:complete len:446 (+) comp20168_c0_seq1:3695-5032(+)
MLQGRRYDCWGVLAAACIACVTAAPTPAPTNQPASSTPLPSPSPTSQPTRSPDTPEKSADLGSAAITGVVLSALLVAGLLCLLGVWFLRHRQEEEFKTTARKIHSELMMNRTLDAVDGENTHGAPASEYSSASFRDTIASESGVLRAENATHSRYTTYWAEMHRIQGQPGCDLHVNAHSDPSMVGTVERRQGGAETGSNRSDVDEGVYGRISLGVAIKFSPNPEMRGIDAVYGADELEGDYDNRMDYVDVCESRAYDYDETYDNRFNLLQPNVSKGETRTSQPVQANPSDGTHRGSAEPSIQASGRESSPPPIPARTHLCSDEGTTNSFEQGEYIEAGGADEPVLYCQPETATTAPQYESVSVVLQDNASPVIIREGERASEHLYSASGTPYPTTSGHQRVAPPPDRAPTLPSRDEGVAAALIAQMAQIASIDSQENSSTKVSSQ